MAVLVAREDERERDETDRGDHRIGHASLTLLMLGRIVERCREPTSRVDVGVRQRCGSLSTGSGLPTSTEAPSRAADSARSRSLSSRRHDKWSSHQMNEISISGDVWILSQGADGDAPTPTDDYGHLSTTDDQLRLEDGACSLVLQYKVEGESSGVAHAQLDLRRGAL